MNASVKDTQIPIEFIPLIISHWWDVYYKGPGFTVAELRKFLEDKLRAGLYSEDAVRTWIYHADGWRTQWYGICPRYVNSILEEYESSRQVA